MVRLRFESTQRFTFLRKGTMCRSTPDLSSIVARARTESVELMTHPGIEDERKLLLSDEWSDAIAGVPIGTLADL